MAPPLLPWPPPLLSWPHLCYHGPTSVIMAPPLLPWPPPLLSWPHLCYHGPISVTMAPPLLPWPHLCYHGPTSVTMAPTSVTMAPTSVTMAPLLLQYRLRTTENKAYSWIHSATLLLSLLILIDLDQPSPNEFFTDEAVRVCYVYQLLSQLHHEMHALFSVAARCDTFHCSEPVLYHGPYG